MFLFESYWYFCHITESRWFRKWLPRNKVQKIASYSFCNRKTPVLETFSNKVACLKEEVLRILYFFIEDLPWLFLSVWWSNVCRHSLFNQKHNLGWFLLKSVVDLVGVCSLHITCRNHSITFLLISLQKSETSPK